VRIRVENLRQEFGETVALDDVSFSFESGQVHGFIGPNGSGKTTTLRILATLQEPTAGDAFFDDVSCLEYPDLIQPKVGFVPDVMHLRQGITVEDYLDYFARVALPNAAECEAKLREVMDFTGVTPIADKLLPALSRGMQQRLALGRELMHDPEVLLLDEPAAGLDPRARLDLLGMLRELAERGKAVFLSSHILDELTQICHAVTILERGKVMEHGPLADIRKRHLPNRTITARVLEGAEALRNRLCEMKLPENPRIEGNAVQFELSGGDAELAEVSADIQSSGLKLIEFSPVNGELSRIYFKATKGEVQ
jgi:ABC-2 type transport system ATP-binding protein